MQPPFEAIRAAIERHQNIYITTHVGPDGDAVGPALALKSALETQGKRVVYVSRDGVPQSSRFIPNAEQVLLAPPEGFKPDLTFVLDCDGTPGRVASPYEPIENAKERILIDHHRTSQPIFETNWIDPNQPATAMMIYELLIALGYLITADMAQCLLTGLSCDTGHFRFGNTSPAALKAASHLVELGADPAEVAFKLFDERSVASARLLGIALSKMQVEHEGALVWTALTMADFLSIGTGDESAENVVNALRSVKGARMALIFRERKDDMGIVARISVRADPELRADLFASEFQGGGHAAAAGCKQRGEFNLAVKRVVSRALQWLDEEHPSLSMES